MIAYIDPGTGSMLFTILLALIGAGVYSLRMLVVKLKFVLTGGKKVQANGDRIPFVIFSDNKRYWNVFDPICREFNRRGQDVVYMTASEDDPGLNSPYEHVKGVFLGEGNKAYAKLNFLKADIVLSTTPGLDVYQWKRSKDVKEYVHILHAAGEVSMYRMFGIDYYDAMLLAGQYQADDVRKLETLRNLPAKEIELVGITYMDEMKHRLEQIESEAQEMDKTCVPQEDVTVLLAPSWGPEAIFSKYGDRILKLLVDTGSHIIIRPHPQSWISETQMLEKLQAAYPESNQIEWNRDLDNFEVLRRSDIMISDFSGVIFDFTLIFDKPIIYTEAKMDTAIYDAWWLDEPLWTYRALSKMGLELNDGNLDSLKQLIQDCLTNEAFAKGRDEMRSEGWAHPGESAVRTVDFLMDKYEELQEQQEA